jgi:HEAT repeat protein
VKRKLAAKALGEAGDTKALPALQDVIQQDPNADVREAAQAAIAQLRP